MTANRIPVKKLYLQVATVSNDGVWLELLNSDDGESISDVGPYPAAWFRADSGERIKFEYAAQEGVMSIPLEELERAISAARRNVRSEDACE